MTVQMLCTLIPEAFSGTSMALRSSTMASQPLSQWAFRYPFSGSKKGGQPLYRGRYLRCKGRIHRAGDTDASCRDRTFYL